LGSPTHTQEGHPACKEILLQKIQRFSFGGPGLTWSDLQINRLVN